VNIIKSVKLNLSLLVGLLLLLSTPVQSQFIKTLREGSFDEGYSVLEASDGGLVVIGETYSYPTYKENFLLAKFNATGNLIWARTLGGTGWDRGHSVIEASDGGLVVAGFTNSFGAGGYDFLIAKFNASGNLVWTRILGGPAEDEGHSVIEASDGGLLVTGYTYSFGAGGSDLLLAKFNASGTLLWARTLGGTLYDYGYSVIEASDRGLIVVGVTSSFGSGGDLLLAKFDVSGTLLWARALGGSSYDYGYSVIETSDGELVVGGVTNSFGAGWVDFLVAKFDASGNHLWTRTLGGTNEEDGEPVVTEASDGGLVMVGTTYGFGAGYYDLLLSKFDGSGNHLWTRTLGGGASDYGNFVIEISDGGLVVTGFTQSFGYGQDLLLARLDASGNTCLGEFVTPTVTGPTPTVQSISPTVTTPTPTITSPSPTVTSPVPYITVVCEVPPQILSINDVGNDQGKQVRVKWHRCYFDTVGFPVTITEYSIWRRVDQYKGNIPGEDFVIKEAESLDQMLENIINSRYGDRYLITETGDLWDFIATVPAMQFTEYSYVAPTLADSTYEDGMYWSVFFVSAHTQNPTVHYDSDPDSGYSLDNIPPLPIRDLVVDPNSWFTLQWIVPGEYLGERPISTYDIRYNTVPVDADTQAWWNSATACAGEGFFNYSVGKTDSLKVAKDCGCHPVVYFAIKGLDSRPNASEISNIIQFKCGDANGDVVVNVNDVVYLINYLFVPGSPPPDPMAVGDVNCDGKVDVTDVVYLINSLFVAGSPPPCGP